MELGRITQLYVWTFYQLWKASWNSSIFAQEGVGGIVERLCLHNLTVETRALLHTWLLLPPLLNSGTPHESDPLLCVEKTMEAVPSLAHLGYSVGI